MFQNASGVLALNKSDGLASKRADEEIPSTTLYGKICPELIMVNDSNYFANSVTHCYCGTFFERRSQIITLSRAWYGLGFANPNPNPTITLSFVFLFCIN